MSLEWLEYSRTHRIVLYCVRALSLSGDHIREHRRTVWLHLSPNGFIASSVL